MAYSEQLSLGKFDPYEGLHGTLALKYLKDPSAFVRKVIEFQDLTSNVIDELNSIRDELSRANNPRAQQGLQRVITTVWAHCYSCMSDKKVEMGDNYFGEANWGFEPVQGPALLRQTATFNGQPISKDEMIKFNRAFYESEIAKLYGAIHGAILKFKGEELELATKLHEAQLENRL